MPDIHPTAIVDSEAELADDVSIGPYCIVGPNVKIGAGSKLIAHCFISGHTTMGRKNTVYPYASLGTPAQDYDFEGGVTYLKIGDENIFREGVTVNSGTKPESATVIGNGCFLMANAHVAHNCVLGDKVILVAFAGLSGYVSIGDSALISGLTGVHQFCRVGRLAVLSGGSTISQDLPPFMIGDGRNGSIRGVNLVGFRRNNFSSETIRTLKNMYRIFYRSDLNAKNALEKIKTELPQIPEVVEFVDFVESSKRGVLQGRVAGRRA